MSNTRSIILKILLALSLGSNLATLSAQENDNIYELDPLEVRAEQEPGDLTMSSAQIERLQATDLSDLFSNQSTLAVGGGSSVSQKIYVRGFEDTMLNVTVDGAQQIGELYHHQGRLQLEPDFIKKIELDAGAGPATNGAGALTGALKVTLKNAFDMLEGNQSFGSYFRGSAGFNGKDYKLVGSSYGKITDKIGVIASYTQAEGDDYKDGNGNRVTPTGYTHQRGYVKVNGTAHLQEWSIAYEKLHDFGTYYERPHLTNFTGSFILSDHAMNRETATLNYEFDAENDRVDLRSTLYWTNSEYQNHRNTTGALYGEGNLESVGFDLRNSMKFNQHGLTYGLDYRHDTSDSTQQATPPAYWGSSKQTAQIIGLYAQEEWQLFENLLLTAGLRFDSYDHKVKSGVGAGVSNDGNGVSPNIGASWSLSKNVTLQANYARAYRGVTIREAFFSALYAHDGTLKAEIADNVELGFTWEQNGFYFRGTGYQQNIENYINAEYIGGPVAWGYWRNSGDAKVKGYEFEAGKHWQNAFLSLGVWDAKNTFNRQALADSNLGLGTSIGRTWTARAQYNFTPQHLELGLTVRYVEDEPNTITPTAPDKESYVTTDLTLTWKPLGDNTLVIAAAIRNLFDEFYYDHATYSYHSSGKYIGFPAKGREPSISVALKF